MPVPRAVAALLLVLLLAAAPASAFDSVPPTRSVHDRITAVAADAGWSSAAVQALQQAVREPDYDESGLDPDGTDLARVDATADYRPEHHCDRVPPSDDAAALAATVAYVQAQRASARDELAAGNASRAMAALGRALHALQDCYSHSDIVERPGDQAAFEAALLHGGDAPAGVRLTGYQPGADDPESPPDDPYPHAAHAKDSADKNDDARTVVEGNTTRFEAAVGLARMATVAFLQEFAQDLPTGQRADLMGVREHDGGLPDDVNVPALSVSVLVVAVAAVAGLRRR